MEHALSILQADQPAPRARTCIWMDAGAVSFRLCDRGFACEHCPFDAAMRRDPAAEPLPGPDPAPWSFPADRLYTPGHSWVQVIAGPRLRAGLDAFAARLLGDPLSVLSAEPGEPLARGAALARVSVPGGDLVITAPVPGRFDSRNRALDSAPGLLASDPYADGWLAELIAAQPWELDGLLNAAEARRAAEADLHLLRREVAFRLISGNDTPGGGPGLLGCAARLLGTDPYVELARRFLHEPGR
jgi:glycine cleavage system H protein